MSILGYSSAYFLPQYWVNTPLYGEKIIPLLDYVLSTDYQYTDKLASAFYDIESKYKNTADLPIDKVEAIIEESGYQYIRDLLGQDEDSLRLLVYLLVLINELKASKRGIETVLNLLKTRDEDLQLHVIGNPRVTPEREVTDFSEENYITFSNFTTGDNPFELLFQVNIPGIFEVNQCIASSPDHGFYLGINPEGKIELKVGKISDNRRVWQSLDGRISNLSNKELQKNTNYYIKFYYTGSAYGVSISKDGVTYENYLDLESSTGLSIVGGTVLIGVDGSSSTTKEPFLGSIYLAPFNVTASSIKITQWYETFPVGEENTFTIEADVDVNLVSSDFFVKFAKFIERYVYPSLASFKANLALKAKLTFLPYARQKINYIASNIIPHPDGYEPFMVKEPNVPDRRETFNVRTPKLYAWTYAGFYVYTLSDKIFAATKLYNRDMTPYLGNEFSVKELMLSEGTEFRVFYGDIVANRDENADIYSGEPFLTIEESN